MKTHLVIRSGTAPGGDTHLQADPVEEHNRIATTHSTVLFGKIGRKVDARKLALLQQAAVNGESKLYLIRKQKGTFEGWSARLGGVHTDEFAHDLEKVPTYYHHLKSEVVLWLEIGPLTRTPSDELDRLVLVSSGKGLLETLGVCRTSLMLVQPVSEEVAS